MLLIYFVSVKIILSFQQFAEKVSFSADVPLIRVFLCLEATLKLAVLDFVKLTLLINGFGIHSHSTEEAY